MSPIDAALVRRKLAVISRNLADLEPIAGLSLETYRIDRFRLKGTERLLQELIEAAMDANIHLLRGLDHAIPTEYFRSFIALGEAGVIPQQLAAALAPSAGLRNRLVHEYETTDDAIILASVRTARVQFSEYVKAVEEFLGKQQV